MAADSPPPTGLCGALRTLGDTLVGTVQDRLELVSVELQEEKIRLVQMFAWISAALFAGMMTLIFASLTLVYTLGDDNRPAALGGLAVLYGTGLVVIVVAFRRHLARQPKPFAASLREIREDRACIRTGN
jgi:uncharacterized membrane protein YqjE